jgi:hypothetical protein
MKYYFIYFKVVFSFAVLMYKKMLRNKRKKTLWREVGTEDLYDLMKLEYLELDTELVRQDHFAIVDECTGVANFAAMIADKSLAVIKSSKQRKFV